LGISFPGSISWIPLQRGHCRCLPPGEALWPVRRAWHGPPPRWEEGYQTRSQLLSWGVQELKSSGSVASPHCLRPTASVEACTVGRSSGVAFWGPSWRRWHNSALRWGCSAFRRCLGPQGDPHVNLWGRTTLGLLFAARSAVGLGLL